MLTTSEQTLFGRLRSAKDFSVVDLRKTLLAGMATSGGSFVLSGHDLTRRIGLAAAWTDTAASMAKKRAGSYRKGSYTDRGLTIKIENPRGSIRQGLRPDGTEWRTYMPVHYGYVANTISPGDEDGIDVYLGENHASDKVFVIEQVIDGEFDEHKCVLYASSSGEAEQIYLSCYDPGWKGLGAMKEMTWDEFKSWCRSTRLAKSFDGEIEIAKAYNAGGNLYVYGCVLVPDKTDRQGQWITKDEIRKAVRRFMDYQTPGIQHRWMLDRSQATLTQNFIAPCDFVVGGKKFVEGSWMVEFRIDGERLKESVKAGDFKAFSIGGRAKIRETNGVQ